MIAQDSFPGALGIAVSVLVFVLVVAALAVDRVRMQRRLGVLERSEALLETDLADTRRRLDELRTTLRRPTDTPTTGAVGPPGNGELTG